MKRAALRLAWLVATLVLFGCRQIPVERVRLVKDEVATIGSLAKLTDPPTADDIAAIESRVQKALAHIDEVAK